MRFSDSHRMLFVHVQKTGGQAVRDILATHIDDLRGVRRRQSKHETLRVILKREPELFGYWTFGFVRNPWARMVSWWSMIEGRAQVATESEWGRGRLEKNPLWRTASQYPDFETFIFRGTEEFKELRTPQLRFLTTKTRRADFIGRQETFDADMRAVLARLGLPPHEGTPLRNPSEHGHYRDYYSDASRKRVAEIYSTDIAAFGYEF